MSYHLGDLDESAKWRLMVNAAKRAAEESGYSLERLPGRGLSNIWNLEKDGRVQTTSIRTTRDRWIAFPPLQKGKKWKTLDDVELVLVASVDSKESPEKVEVYMFDADDVRERFNSAYSARIKAGNSVRDNFGMWINLDTDERGLPASVGSGLGSEHEPLAVYSIASLVESVSDADMGSDGPADTETTPLIRAEQELPLTIAEAKRRLADTLGVDPSAIKITVEA